MKSSPLSLFAAVTMIPAMIGPLAGPAEGMVLTLCTGGTVTIEIPRQPAPAPGTQPCCAKGCHTGCSRKRAKRTA